MRYLALGVVFVGLCIAGAWAGSTAWGPTPLGFFATWLAGGLMSLVAASAWRAYLRARVASGDAGARLQPRKPTVVAPKGKFRSWVVSFTIVVMVGFGLQYAAIQLPVWLGVVVFSLIAGGQALALFVTTGVALPTSWGDWADIAAWGLAILIVVAEGVTLGYFWAANLQ